ncbi:MMPL family transporter [Nocardia sp. BMG111209]|uniref:MMPL family transporter n=1 Tax=Nocardia sp. BMG111209 TaxID=1160137 RepID=UPI000364FCAC|nr:MMPL family transporter [Nocardia sp. BMG111209]
MSAPPAPDSTTLAGRLARIPSGRRTKWIVLAAWLIAILALGGFAGKLNGAEKNDNIQWLPGAAESTQAYQLGQRFGGADEVPVVFVYERASGLTDTDRAVAAADVTRFAQVPGVAAPSIVGPVPAKDGQALEVLVPIPVGHGGWDTIGATVGKLKAAAGTHPPGLSMLPTGPAGYAAEFSAAFKGIDGTLLYATAAVVIVILLLTYGPMLWILPLLAAGGALSVAMSAVYGATGAGLTVTAQSAGILTILVFGAGTDYALLLIARYREELRRHEDRHEAMAVALHRAGPAILASGTTVIVAMLVLLVAELNSTKGVGPVCAIGVAVALLAMLTLLPALMVIPGRWIFWPRHPNFGTEDHTATGIWSRVGTLVAARPRTIWLGTGAALLALSFGVTGLHNTGLTNEHSFTKTTDAVRGNQALARHFDLGTGSPVVVIAKTARLQEVSSAIAATPGITAPAAAHTSGDLMQIQATLTDAPDSAAAGATIDRLRSTLHTIEGADAKVGGDTAIRMDIERASSRDNRVVVPVVLLVVMAILMLLLRSLLAPVLLTLTVVLSFFAALGLSTLVFHAVGFHGADPALPLLAFVFLVALGIDYNIFLMSRVHEEAKTEGTRRGALTGLSATGGVITSAGLVLAGTFAVFATMPMVAFAEVGLVIMIGVLLDTLIVRSILVTALSLDIGDRIWWPNPLSRRRDPEPEREPVPALN